MVKGEHFLKQTQLIGHYLKLKNGYFLETNLSAEYIYKFCNQAIQTIGLSSEDWQVIY